MKRLRLSRRWKGGEQEPEGGVSRELISIQGWEADPKVLGQRRKSLLPPHVKGLAWHRLRDAGDPTARPAHITNWRDSSGRCVLTGFLPCSGNRFHPGCRKSAERRKGERGHEQE